MEIKVSYQGKEPYTNNFGYNSNPGYSNNPLYPQPVPVSNQSGWFAQNRKNKPQSNSAGAAGLVFVSGGMNIAWRESYEHHVYISAHVLSSWFIAAIVGAIVGAALCNHLQKKLIYLLSCVLVVVGGILLVTLSTDVDALIVARCFDGFANGLVFVSTLVMIGEEGVTSLRGMLASSIETMCFALGFYLQMIYSGAWSSYYSFDVIQLQGVICIVFGCISLIIAFFLIIESPIFYLTRGQEERAIDALRRLQRPFIVTTETYEQFEEHKRYIAINKQMSLAQSAISGLPALVKLCFYRGLIALSFTSLLTGVFAESSEWTFQYSWPFIVYGTLRWIGVLVCVFILDSAGRKKPMLFGAVVCGALMIGIGRLTADGSPFISYGDAIMSLLMVFQFFAGMFSASSSAYLCEGFPLAIKPYYIAISFCVEMIVHVIALSCALNYQSATIYSYTFGALLLVFFALGLICLPETKQTTLREAQDKFRRFVPPRN